MKNILIQDLQNDTYEVQLHVENEIADLIVQYHRAQGKTVHVRDVKVLKASRISATELSQVEVGIIKGAL